MTPNVLGGLDPVPPKPGIVALLHAPLALLVISAVLAYLLSRKDRRHRPVAIGLGVMAAAALGRLVMDAPLTVDGPHVGWMRAMFHVDQALLLVGVVALPWLAHEVFCELPPGPSRRRSAAAGSVWAWFLLTMILGYPELRGELLRRLYLVNEMIALFVCAVAIASWALRRGWTSKIPPSVENAIDACERAMGPGARNTFEWIAAGAAPQWYTAFAVLALVGADVALLAFGAWRWGLFGDAYTVQQAGLLALYVAIAGAHVVALMLTRRAQ